MALTAKYRSSIYQNIAPIIGEEEAGALLDQFPSRDLDEPVSKDFVRSEAIAVRSELATGLAEVRSEMTTGFAEVRSDMAAGLAEVRSEMTTGFAEVRSEMTTGFAEVRSEMTTGFAEVRSDMAAGLAEVRAEMAQMRVELLDKMSDQFRWFIGMWLTTIGLIVAVALRAF